MKTSVTSPHKIYGPETNDLVLQLRKRGINKIILAGMSANLCVESHLRELIENGFEVSVVKDATAAAILPDQTDKIDDLSRATDTESKDGTDSHNPHNFLLVFLGMNIFYYLPVVRSCRIFLRSISSYIISQGFR